MDPLCPGGALVCEWAGNGVGDRDASRAATAVGLLVRDSRELDESRATKLFLVAMALAFSSPLFVNPFLEYRLDAVAILLFLAAFRVVARGKSILAWVSGGALFAASVLANMRLAPLIVLTAAAFAFVDLAKGRWGWNPRALWMAGGVLPVAACFVFGLWSTGTWPAFADGVFEYNRASNALIDDVARGSGVALLRAPFENQDLTILAMVVMAIVGGAYLAKARLVPTALHLLALVAAASLVFVPLTGVQYPYHLLSTFVFMLPLAAYGFERLMELQARATILIVVLAISVAGCALLAARVFSTSFGEAMDYQNAVMSSTDARTPREGRVLDGVGYALRREPAQHYWFLPAGIRLLAAQGKLQTISLHELEAAPPAAIVYGVRMQHWLGLSPDMERWAFSHYVPLYRDLSVAGFRCSPGRATETRPVGCSGHWPVSDRRQPGPAEASMVDAPARVPVDGWGPFRRDGDSDRRVAFPGFEGPSLVGQWPRSSSGTDDRGAACARPGRAFGGESCGGWGARDPGGSARALPAGSERVRALSLFE